MVATRDDCLFSMEIEVQARLDQLWKAAVEIFPTHPSLSQSYVRTLIRLVHDNGITLANSFYWNVCSHCGCIWYCDVSCLAHLYTYRRLRYLVRKDRNKYLLMSKIMHNEEDGPSIARNKCCFIVYECKACDKSSIFNGHPLYYSKQDKNNGEPAITLGKTDTTRSRGREVFINKKINQLQKILQRSKTTKSNTSNSSTLGDFLKGLDNKNN